MKNITHILFVGIFCWF